MLSRRDVLTTTVAAGAGLVPGVASMQPATAQPARRIIVDSQVHIWLADTHEHRWPADGIGQAHIPRPFSYYELLARMDEAGVDRVVIVPPSWEGYHNAYAMEAAKKWPHRFAVIGPPPPRRSEIEGPAPHLEGSAWHAGRPAHFQPFADRLAHGRHCRLVLAGRRQGGLPVMTSTAGRARDFLRIVERNPRPHLHHRPHEPVR